eukprot:13058749-Heterocapsa_arctica.AAC.1
MARSRAGTFSLRSSAFSPTLRKPSTCWEPRRGLRSGKRALRAATATSTRRREPGEAISPGWIS